jgi:hypothetical protein
MHIDIDIRWIGELQIKSEEKRPLKLYIDSHLKYSLIAYKNAAVNSKRNGAVSDSQSRKCCSNANQNRAVRMYIVH